MRGCFQLHELIVAPQGGARALEGLSQEWFPDATRRPQKSDDIVSHQTFTADWRPSSREVVVRRIEGEADITELAANHPMLHGTSDAGADCEVRLASPDIQASHAGEQVNL